MIRECEICNRKIRVKKERISNAKHNTNSIVTSKEGVFFEYNDSPDSFCGVWFCNKHWEEVRK